MKNPFAKSPPTPEQEAALQRSAEWEQALKHDRLPGFVEKRLGDARNGVTPWTSTMTAPELYIAVTRGVRPIAMVSGTCWHQFGRSWTEGHSAGWRSALYRLQTEALACGANAVVDVKMRTVRGSLSESMDFTLVGTAIKLDGLPPSSDPIIATVPLLEFVRILQAGVVPISLVIGAQHDWLIDNSKTFSGSWTWNNQELKNLSHFWETLRRRSYRELSRDAVGRGNGVLAHTQFSQLIKVEGDKSAPDRYLGRHIVIGTAVQAGEASPIIHGIETVIDMCDGPSPLDVWGGGETNLYGSNEREGGI